MNKPKSMSKEELKDYLRGVMLGCVYPGGMSASILSGNFGAMLFSRDLLRVMRDSMPNKIWRPFCRQMFSVLPQWQGVKYDPTTNERLDAFQHQVFLQIVGGIQLADELVENIEYWTGKWGVKLNDNPVDGKNFAVYNSSDAPALYLIALTEFIKLEGSDDILRDRFYHRPTGEMRTVAEAASRCLDFIMRSCRESEQNGLGGLYAVPNDNDKQTSPTGKLEDGFDAVLRPQWNPDGTLSAARVDYSYAAYIDHQSLAVWALEAGADKLFPNDERTRDWRKQAQHIREETLRSFWMSDSQFFGVSIDRIGLSKLETVSALELLNGTILKGVKDAPDYVGSLVRWAYSPEVLTPVGPRMTSLKFQEMWGTYLAYQGPGSVWPVRTQTAFTGFLNWGLPALAYDMGIMRNVGFLQQSGMSLEATYVDPVTNTPLFNPLPEHQNIESADVILNPSSPFEPGQNWTASAGLCQLRWEESLPAMPSLPSARPSTWQLDLEMEMIQRSVQVAFPSEVSPDILVAADYDEGGKLKQEFAALLGLSA